VRLQFEGVPTYPTPSRCWQTVEKYGVTKFYTAPTAIRALMAFKRDCVTAHDRSSLRVLGTVGEPINPAAWHWYNEVVGEKRCAIVDTYWQTETVKGLAAVQSACAHTQGGHVLTPLPGAIATKPGSATLPFFGCVPALLDNKGQEIEGPGEGSLVSV
jgi:acetyl-CoA synthetase